MPSGFYRSGSPTLSYLPSYWLTTIVGLFFDSPPCPAASRATMSKAASATPIPKASNPGLRPRHCRFHPCSHPGGWGPGMGFVDLGGLRGLRGLRGTCFLVKAALLETNGFTRLQEPQFSNASRAGHP